MKKSQRPLKEIRAEIKEAKARFTKNYGGRKIRKSMPMLFSALEIEAMLHITWLEGYERAVRDERGLE